VATVERIRAELRAERDTPQFARKRQADALRRGREQAGYVAEFRAAVLGFLSFDPRHADLAERLAVAVADHATPVGSGTVARTQRIEVHERAEAAVIAWMRHQTTGYDDMQIARVAGRRREVRRELAQLSRAVIDLHRGPLPHAPSSCPLCTAVEGAQRA